MSDKEIDNILKEIKENKDKLIESEDKKMQDSINEVEFNLTVDNKKNEPEQETVNDVVSEKSPKDEEVYFDLTEAPVDDETKEDNNTKLDVKLMNYDKEEAFLVALKQLQKNLS